jgi:hypothetical protein
MQTVKFKEESLPINYGMATQLEFAHYRGVSNADFAKAFQNASTKDFIVLHTIALNQGARKVGTGKKYTWEGVADMLDEVPDFALKLGAAFVESQPQTGTTTGDKPGKP